MGVGVFRMVQELAPGGGASAQVFKSPGGSQGVQSKRGLLAVFVCIDFFVCAMVSISRACTRLFEC